MSTNQSRLELQIDVFDQTAQRALALPMLLPAELVAAVIEEFREIEFLGSNPANYQLRKAADRTPLDEQIPVGQQLAAGERLAFVEREEPLPPGTQRPSRPIYLREQGTDTVYRLHWQPAIIGRPDASLNDNQQIAVNLSAHPAGQRVSRRHAQIVESKGQFFVERLAQNSTVIKDSQGNTTAVESDRRPIRHGDTIVLENSQIVLKFMVRDKEPTP
jgi:FHA domain